MTDIHAVRILNSVEAAANLKWTLYELGLLSPKTELILATKRGELDYGYETAKTFKHLQDLRDKVYSE